MKKQTGFISSSSSVTITYSSSLGSKNFVGWTNVKSTENGTYVGQSYSEYGGLTTTTASQTVSWVTTASKSYQRIEYFLEAVEKINSPFSKNDRKYMNFLVYDNNVASDNLYKGFVDIVITFPTEIRLAGLELLNPWAGKKSSDSEYNYWKYLPSKFSIFKVDNTKINDALENITYEDDIARKTSYDGTNSAQTFRPIRYDKIETDDKLIFLGKYEINWKIKSNYKCFFKFNSNDAESINLGTKTGTLGTATWKCKQLVLRIYETKMDDDSYNSGNNDGLTNIQYKIGKYIQTQEIKYGSTTEAGKELSVKQCYDLTSITEDINSDTVLYGYSFGSKKYRNYSKAANVKFESGIQYKLGGIQLLLAPDIFSVSEMKMYNYAGQDNNKVYIGEWNKDFQEIEYYGTGTIKTSPFIDISETNVSAISWKHNFNIPPKYLDAQVFIRFNMDYDSFYTGDVISNITNMNKEPLTVKLTGTDVQINISNGIGFTNPDTGEFMSFYNGVGVQMDRPGNYDAYNAAVEVGAKDYILDYGSTVSTKMTSNGKNGKGGCYPFQIYFVIKRLF